MNMIVNKLDRDLALLQVRTALRYKAHAWRHWTRTIRSCLDLLAPTLQICDVISLLCSDVTDILNGVSVNKELFAFISRCLASVVTVRYATLATSHATHTHTQIGHMMTVNLVTQGVRGNAVILAFLSW